MRSELVRALAAEVVATATLVGLGLGSVIVAATTGALGLGSVAAVWGIAVVLLILIAGPASGAHANPAVTIALACWRGFPGSRVGPYLLAQCVGASIASCLLYALFHSSMGHQAVSRGIPLSELIGSIGVERWPHPGLLAGTAVLWWEAALAEAAGAGLIAGTVIAATRPGVPAGLAPPVIGASVALAIIVFAPLSQAGFNPARDLGPRLVAWWAGADAKFSLESLAVYVLAPIAGGWAGAGIAQLLTPLEQRP